MVEISHGADPPTDRLAAAGRHRMLDVLDRLRDEPVTRSRERVAVEMREIRRSRRESSPTPFRP